MSEVIHDTGFVVQRAPYSESSDLLTWLCRGHGIVRTLALGARKPGQPLHGKADLFYECEFTWRRNAKAKLAKVSEIQIRAPHLALRQEYSRILTLTYFYEFIAALAEPEAPIPGLYDLFEKGARHLATHAPTKLLIDRFERRVLQDLGLDDPAQPLSALKARVIHKPLRSQALLRKTLADQAA
jgi:DNA repair protein RecO (recombination protein O)